MLLSVPAQIGYAALAGFVVAESAGVPVPGETALLIGVVVAAQGHLSIAGVVLAGWVGAVAGDNGGYWIGRRWGHRFMAAPGLRRIYRPERVEAAERLMARYGFQAVFLGRFVALLRIFAGPLAGMHRLPWGRFVIANAVGAALWVGAVAAVGVLIGNNLHRATQLLARSGYAGLAIVAVLGAAALVWHHRRRP